MNQSTLPVGTATAATRNATTSHGLLSWLASPLRIWKNRWITASAALVAALESFPGVSGSHLLLRDALARQTAAPLGTQLCSLARSFAGPPQSGRESTRVLVGLPRDRRSSCHSRLPCRRGRATRTGPFQPLAPL